MLTNDEYKMLKRLKRRPIKKKELTLGEQIILEQLVNRGFVEKTALLDNRHEPIPHAERSNVSKNPAYKKTKPKLPPTPPRLFYSQSIGFVLLRISLGALLGFLLGQFIPPRDVITAIFGN